MSKVFEEGYEVYFIPHHAKEDVTHVDVKKGVIERFDKEAKGAFINYYNSEKTLEDIAKYTLLKFLKPTGKMICPVCDGKGKAVFSCCTGDVITGDILRCPSCFENLAEDTCEDCEGTGICPVHSIDPKSIQRIDLILEAEKLSD